MIRNTKTNILKKDFSCNSSPLINYSIFQKKYSNNNLPNFDYTSKEIFLLDDNSNTVSKEGSNKVNSQLINKKNLCPLNTFNYNKDNYFNSSLKVHGCNDNLMNSNYNANFDINSKPSLANLSFLRTNSKNNNKNYFSLNSFHDKNKNKINHKYINMKTPIKSSKEEMQKWLSRI